MKTKLIIVIAFLFSFTKISAQDIITKKNGEKIMVIIKEVTKNTIIYVDYNDVNGVLFTIDKVLISKVKFQYGKYLNVKNPEKNPMYFFDDKINNIMINFSAIAGNTLAVAYEKNLKIGQSLMIEAKIYGIGIEPEGEIKKSGAGLGISYRLKTASLFNKESYRPKHILHGVYIAPTIGFSTGKNTSDYSYSYNSNQTTHTLNHSIFYFGINYGKQLVLQRRFTIDYSFGFYYYFGKDSNTDEYNQLNLGNMAGSNNKLFGFNLRIGYLTGKTGAIKNK